MPSKKSELTKDAVYHAALALMEEKGFRGATIRDICKRANVSIGTFYCYFENKSDVLREIYLAGDSFFLETVESELSGRPALEQLRLFVRYYARLNIDTGLDIVKVLYNPDNECFRQDRPMQLLLRRIIAQGQATGELTCRWSKDQIMDYIFDFLRGVCYNWCLHEAHFDLEERMATAIEITLQGLLPHAAAPRGDPS